MEVEGRRWSRWRLRGCSLKLRVEEVEVEGVVWG